MVVLEDVANTFVSIGGVISLVVCINCVISRVFGATGVVRAVDLADVIRKVVAGVASDALAVFVDASET